MNFGKALTALQEGQKVRRMDWDRVKFVALMPGLILPPYNSQDSVAKVNDRTAKYIGKDKPLDSRPYFSSYNNRQQWQPGWLPSVEDILAEDWEVV
jgi:hypothetical protein